MNKDERTLWATAIAERISDEWEGSKSFPEEAALLRAHLQKSLSHDGNAIKSFIETGVIESDYFQSL